MSVRIGEYEVVRPLGRGGAAAVYEVRRADDPRRLALKLMARPAAGSAHGARLLERFRREGELLARLRHPGVVAVHSAGVSREGQPYMVFEHCPGGSLADLLAREGPLPIEQVLAIGRSLAGTLGYAHARGVVHRDVKPDNVLIDERGHVRLADFGIALAADLERLTLTGAFVGSPLYMAPEQITDPSRIGPPTDVHALGALLYECLAGAPPFDDGEGGAALLRQIVEVRPTPVERRRPDAPPGLARVLERCLEKDPADRHPDGDALARALTDLDAEVGPAPSRVRARRRRTAAAGATALAAATAVAGVVAWRAAPRDGPAPLAQRDPTRPDPDDRSPPSSPAASPVPEASPVEAGPLAWQLEPGAAFPVELTMVLRRRFVVLGTTLEEALTRRVQMTWEVLDLEPAAATFEVTVDALRVEASGGRVEVDYDSERSSRPPSPLDAAIGRAFTFRLDPRTGRVWDADGAADLEEALASAPSLGPTYAIFSSYHESAPEVLALLLDLLPSSQADSAAGWSRPLRVASRDGLRRIRAAPTGAGGWHLESELVEGSLSPGPTLVRLHGQADFRDGRLVASSYSEELTEGQGVLGAEVTASLRIVE